MKLGNDDQLTLEQLVDKGGLDEVLELLSRICSEKAMHLETNWQDEVTAKAWIKKANLLDSLAVRFSRE